jgi:phage-related protein
MQNNNEVVKEEWSYMIGLHRFRYNGYSSQDFDLLTDVSFDEDSGETESFLNREAVASEVYNGTLKRVHNFKYTEKFAPKITLIKNTFDDFTETEVRRVLSWLTSSNTPKFLTAYYDDSEVVSFEILGAPTSIELHKLANNRVVGIVFTFESSAPYAFSPIQTVEKNIIAPQEFTITCNSDELGALVYPKITITHKVTDSLVVQVDEAMGEANKSEHIPGTVYHYKGIYYWIDDEGTLHENSAAPLGWQTTSVLIENATTNSKTIISGNISQEIVTLDGANRVVASSLNIGRIFGDDFNWQWMPLTPGENTITVTGSCTIKFEWREPRKVGF